MLHFEGDAKLDGEDILYEVRIAPGKWGLCCEVRIAGDLFATMSRRSPREFFQVLPNFFALSAPFVAQGKGVRFL